MHALKITLQVFTKTL